MRDDLPHETENTVYRYLSAISKLRLGILTEQGEGSSFFYPSQPLFIYLFPIYLFIIIPPIPIYLNLSRRLRAHREGRRQGGRTPVHRGAVAPPRP